MQRPVIAFVLGSWLPVVAAVGCGGGSSDDGASSDSTSEDGTESMGSTGSMGVTGPGDSTGPGGSAGSGGSTAGMDTVADSTGPSSAGTDTESDDATTEATESTGATGDCQVWEITYDLEGSQFEVSDTPLMAGDQVNTVTMPYDADDHVGPGTFVLRFENVGGEPGGMAALVSYDMVNNFVVDSGFTVVTTDLVGTAGPEECGVTGGMVDGTTVAWMPSAIVGHHSMGEILCNGGLCGVGGLPDGMPVPVDEVTDQPLDDFDFSMDFSSFTMNSVVIAMDANSTTAWSYEGTETNRELVDGPDCFCP